MIHHISSEWLTIDKVSQLLQPGVKLELSDDARSRIIRCREYLDNKMKSQKEPIYGITTGFGSLCNISIGADQLKQLQKNLVMSHSCGVGERVPREIVRLMLLLKAQSLSYGNSGVQLITVQRLLDFFNNDVTPVVYQQGSLGASGDLAPLANMSLPLIGLGEVEYKGVIRPAAEVLAEFGWEPVELQSKEGLALLNGTQFMSSYGVWSLINARRLSALADKIGAMSLDAFDGRIEPFCDPVNVVRNHAGQVATARAVRRWLEGSEITVRPKAHVQDPYSFRCMPQVHGAAKDTIEYVWRILEEEINAPTDNPTVFPDEDLIVSAGNFHGEPIALPMDFLAVAVSELANISERRIYTLIGGKRDLPSFLVANPGVNSGFMIPQYAAASIVNQSKGLCWPNSCDSIPSSQGQEDHVSMGSNSATKLYRIVLNTERVLAIELFNSAQALEFRRPLKSSPAIEEWHARYRETVPFIEDDTVMSPLIEASIQFIRNTPDLNVAD
ncbi:histidine ammonia-lyase [Muribaculaceae bacterium Isolate-013 (NCI)]|nr:histidine ammonia-lyase [Muribaculaceae bacterium Isolate-013 (NCI)]